RLGLVSDDSSAIAVWSDTRTGTIDSNKQDIGSARVVFEESAGRTAAKYMLLGVGVALALAGLIVLGYTLRARRGPERELPA
ncbi:MAG: hypothetical protein ACREX8_03455, partial [Gammaproteobacteria bacterium]